MLFGFFGFSQKVTTSIDSSQIKIGSQFNLTLKASVNDKDKVVFPNAKNFGALEVLESYPIDTIKNNSQYELIKKYILIDFQLDLLSDSFFSNFKSINRLMLLAIIRLDLEKFGKRKFLLSL